MPEQRTRQRVALMLASPALLVIVCAQASAWLWLGELCTHWTLHAACALFLVSLMARRGSIVQMTCIMVAILGLLPWVMSAYQVHMPPTRADGDHTVSIGCANLYDFNQSRPRMRAMLHDAPLEIFGLEEVKKGDQDAVRQDPRWPFQEWTLLPDMLNVALLSVHPIMHTNVYQLEHAVVLEAILHVHGHPLRVLVTHLSSPHHGPVNLGRQNFQLAMLSALVHDGVQPVVAIGDFNITPGTPRWRTFLHASGLSLTAGHELATWPAMLGPLGIPIDHIFVHGAIAENEHIFAVPGSDHRGVSTRLVLDRH